jgi:hypothetical protein
MGVRRDRNCEGDYDFYFIKADSEGNTQWTKQVEHSEIQFHLCIAVTPDYGYVSCGYGYLPVPGNTEVWLVKLKTDVAGSPEVEWTTSRGSLSVEGSNPFADAIRVSYEVPTAGRVKLGVYDVGGRLVAELLNGTRPAGVHEAEWNLGTDGGERVASGVYFIRLESPGCRGVEKVLVLR